MSGHQTSLVRCYKMSTTENYNGSIRLDNVSTSGNQSPDFIYSCQYLDLNKRALQLVKEPYSALALVLGFTGIVINILCLFAIYFQMRGRFTAHFRFIVSLALSDILVCVSVISHYVNQVLNPTLFVGEGPSDFRLRSRCAYILIKALNTTALNSSLLNLTGMALDHFIAILVPLRCNRLMSTRKSVCLIIFIWILSFICGYSDLFSVIPDREHLDTWNFCELAFITPYQEEFTVFGIAILCLVCMVLIYVKIYIKIHQRRKMSFTVNDDRRCHVSDNMKQTTKALVTTLIILGTFIICWLPLCLFQISLIIQVKVNPAAISEDLIPYLNIADKYLFDLTLLNAIADPIIYAIRMPEVRCGYRKMCWSCSRCFRKKRSLSWQSGTYVSILDKKSSMKLAKRQSNSSLLPQQQAEMKVNYIGKKDSGKCNNTSSSKSKHANDMCISKV